MDNIFKREVVVKPLKSENSLQVRNESMRDEHGNTHDYNPNRKCRIWAKTDKNGMQLRAFTLGEEENYYMPMLINKSKNDPEYYLACDKFWKGVSIIFSPNPGLILNTSFLLAIGNKIVVNGKEVVVSADTFKTYCTGHPELEYLFGQPVNVVDYWQWRFCLVTSQVANSLEIAMNKRGRRMEYYIYTKEEEIASRKASAELRKNSYTLALKYAGDKDVVEGLLRTYEKGRSHNNNGDNLGESFEFEKLVDMEKDDLFLKAAEKYPADFIEIVSNPNLKYKTFLFRAINQGIISIPSGNTTVFYGNDIIGETFDKAIAYLKSNVQVFKEIELKIKQDKVVNRMPPKVEDEKQIVK